MLSSQVPVHAFRQIFQWPLFLEPPGARSGEDRKSALARAQAAVDSDDRWHRVHDLMDHPPKVPDSTDSGGYGEFVYFHDFVQRFLYPAPSEGVFRLYRRWDVLGLRAEIGGVWHRFRVERLTLHMFDLGIAVVTLELSWRGPGALALSDVQRVVDHLRRSYVPFWMGTAPGRVPGAVVLERAGQEDLTAHPPERAEVEGQVADVRDVPVFGHWREMVAPLQLLADGGDWRDPSDERIPCLSYISLTRPGVPDAACLDQVSEGDWIRLADAEEPGTMASPYNPDFLTDFREATFYDRFMPSTANREIAVRHLFGPAHYAAVGAGWFFDEIAVHHFRRHYAQLSLIARFQMTALLAFSSRITAAVARRERGGGWLAGSQGAFEAEILALQDDFLDFTHRFHFTGVSSQDQPREMFDRWRRVMGLDRLYADVKQELDSAADAVRARQGERSSDAQERLAEIAVIGGLIALVVSALGMIDPFASYAPMLRVETWRGLGELSLWLGLLAFLLGVLALRRRLVARLVMWAGGALVLTGFVAFDLSAVAAG